MHLAGTQLRFISVTVSIFNFVTAIKRYIKFVLSKGHKSPIMSSTGRAYNQPVTNLTLGYYGLISHKQFKFSHSERVSITTVTTNNKTIVIFFDLRYETLCVRVLN